jgi:uncharacterized damage-inducible protein DinB
MHMPLNQALLPEFDHEMANTRNTLERVPENKFAWKPHQKSGSMGWLAAHLADLPSWTTMTIKQDSVDIAPQGAPPQPPAAPKSIKELLEKFDKNVKEARAALAGADDATLLKPWSLLKTGQVLMTMPKIACMRTWVMNHTIHHRAQLGVYLRLNDIAVPAIYGPSADEDSM